MFRRLEPARKWTTGTRKKIEISEVGEITLNHDEQVIILGRRGSGYEVTRKSWGFYAAPSLDHRIPSYGLKAMLVINSVGRHYLMLVDKTQTQEFINYCAEESLIIVFEFSSKI